MSLACRYCMHLLVTVRQRYSEPVVDSIVEGSVSKVFSCEKERKVCAPILVSLLGLVVLRRVLGF